jgi:DNA-binding CsgD family transcriptional regulator
MTASQYRKVLDIVSAIGSEGSLQGFLERALTGIRGMFPSEQAFCIVGRALPLPPFEETSLLHLDFPDSAKSAYEGYYCRIDPGRRMTRADTRILSLDFSQPSWAHDEFVADFLHGMLRVERDVVVPLLDPSGRGGLCFGLARGPSSRPATLEEETMLALRPHLANFCSLYKRLESLPEELYYAAELARDASLLSRREAEVAALLCKRLRVPEIATLLLISLRTVERHVANIYFKLNVRSRRELIGKLLGLPQEPSQRRGPGPLIGRRTPR